ncbi:MAG: hypothetical protein V1703_04325 [Candidatus Altiarchaeota archaeon]
MRKTLMLLALAQALSTPASAYIDPGTGSIIFQILIGGLFALAYLLKTKINLIKKILGLSISAGDGKK